eukprot:12418729-Karenia_brevis.AAC.1
MQASGVTGTRARTSPSDSRPSDRSRQKPRGSFVCRMLKMCMYLSVYCNSLGCGSNVFKGFDPQFVNGMMCLKKTFAVSTNVKRDNVVELNK